MSLRKPVFLLTFLLLLVAPAATAAPEDWVEVRGRYVVVDLASVCYDATHPLEPPYVGECRPAPLVLGLVCSVHPGPYCGDVRFIIVDPFALTPVSLLPRVLPPDLVS